MNVKKIRVLVVDDSALVRQVLTSLLSQDPDIEVVGTAPDPFVARDKIRELDPDVLTLDVEMPRMDGISFLEKLMRAHPMPVVMISARTEEGMATTLRALELGAVDFVTKPRLDLQRGLESAASDVIEKVKAAAQARVRHRPATPVVRRETPPAKPARERPTSRIIAVGASTGGTEALRVFLGALPADSPGVLVVQHMPERFTMAFATRLDGHCAVRVLEAKDGDRVLAGHVLVAPGGFHMRLDRDARGLCVRLGSEPPVNHHRPSVDVLFHSCADVAARLSTGVILTGMGSDGAQGLLAMRSAGSRTLAQDEASCVVFGMPRAAIEIGAAEEIHPLDRLAPAALAPRAGCA